MLSSSQAWRPRRRATGRRPRPGMRSTTQGIRFSSSGVTGRRQCWSVALADAAKCVRDTQQRGAARGAAGSSRVGMARQALRPPPGAGALPRGRWLEHGLRVRCLGAHAVRPRRPPSLPRHRGPVLADRRAERLPWLSLHRVPEPGFGAQGASPLLARLPRDASWRTSRCCRSPCGVLPFNIYVVQALFTGVVVVCSYLGHKYFSFGGGHRGDSADPPFHDPSCRIERIDRCPDRRREPQCPC